MYNTILYNNSLLNGNHESTIELVSSDAVSFNGYSLLNNDNVVASSIFYEDIDRNINLSERPRGHGSIFNSSFWGNKRIRVEGWLYASTQTGLEDLIFEFKKQVSAKQGRLDIVTADGSRRRYIATLENSDPVQRGEHWHITACPFSCEFVCSKPFGQSVNPASLGAVVSDLIYNGSVVNEGNTESEIDVILIVNAASAITKINFKNTTTGEEIELETSISDGDIIKIDSTNKQLLLNGVSQDFVGSFITANVGANDYILTATGTSIEYELTTNTPINYL